MKRMVNFETILVKQLKNEEFRLVYEQQRFYLQIAHLISELREKKGISQVELSKKAKVSQPLIARLEKGDRRRTPTFETISKVLKALGYQLSMQIHPEKKRVA